MSWTNPKTWVNDEIVGETDFNTFLRDNMTVLFSPPQSKIATASADYISTTASTAVPMDTANLGATLSTLGGPVEVYFRGIFSAGRLQLGLNVDGTAWGAQFVSGIVVNHGEVAHYPLGYHVWVTGLASGSHTFYPTWASTGQGIRLQWSGNPAVFWAMEAK